MTQPCHLDPSHLPRTHFWDTPGTRVAKTREPKGSENGPPLPLCTPAQSRTQALVKKRMFSITNTTFTERPQAQPDPGTQPGSREAQKPVHHPLLCPTPASPGPHTQIQGQRADGNGCIPASQLRVYNTLPPAGADTKDTARMFTTELFIKKEGNGAVCPQTEGNTMLCEPFFT